MSKTRATRKQTKSNKVLTDPIETMIDTYLDKALKISVRGMALKLESKRKPL